ncbi:hypothetical protein Q8F55_008845 [Vanrija albida]|uniref:Phosphodiest-domain-containing protein n=1 Tax=Vanrija albida TaxID=181172 RepID=A0ABR3PRX4_9TREE
MTGDADDIELEAEMSDAVGAAGQAEEEAPLLVAASQSSRPVVRAKQKASSKHWWTICGTKLPRSLVLLIAVPSLLVIAVVLERRRHRPSAPALPTLSNGTHAFHPTTLVVSIDGFRPQYLSSHAELVPNLIALGHAEHGLRAASMQPVFPTLTFPNHWALLTGLYPESHGIIANDFYAPDLKTEFRYSSKDSWDPTWWWGEPMWSVAERGGRKALNIMWPGPPTMGNGVSPTYFVPYKDKSSTDQKLDQVLHYLDMPLEKRASLLLAYIPDVDKAGHKGGPESADVERAMERADKFIGDLVSAIDARNLSQIVDLIVVSDHGMAATSKNRLVFLDDILGEGYEDVEFKDGWPAYGLRFKPGSDVDAHLATLEAAAKESNGSFAAYTHDTMPERWHFSSGERVAPIYLVPKLGWVITDHEEYNRHGGDELPIKGCHGYDNEYPEMQAIFFAHGPFATRVKAKAKLAARAEPGDGQDVPVWSPGVAPGWESTSPAIMKPFPNLELFSLVMRLQQLEKIAPPTNASASFWDSYL